MSVINQIIQTRGYNEQQMLAHEARNSIQPRY